MSSSSQTEHNNCIFDCFHFMQKKKFSDSVKSAFVKAWLEDLIIAYPEKSNNKAIL